MNKIAAKLCSRKLWLALAGLATGVALALGVDAGDLSVAAGAVTALASVITYIVTEGKIDAAAVRKAAESGSASGTGSVSGTGTAEE